MALTVKGSGADAPKLAQPDTLPKPEPVEEETVVLELALYERLNWRGTMYEKGKAYKFLRQDALYLLDQRDADRPIWRQYHAPKPKVALRTEIMDATKVDMRKVPEAPGLKRIDIGTDDEIADLLPSSIEGEEVDV